MGQKLADVKLAIVINSSLVRLAIGRSIAQDLIYIFMLIGIALQSELQEGSVEIQGVSHLA